jgi:hypothetical protein
LSEWFNVSHIIVFGLLVSVRSHAAGAAWKVF